MNLEDALKFTGFFFAFAILFLPMGSSLLRYFIPLSVVALVLWVYRKINE